jgi:lipopolysaccharide biosynthesis regulator YciM
MTKDSLSFAALIETARQMETEGNVPEAEEIYLQLIKSDVINVEAYNRLLVIYRKQKEYRKELAIVNKAIKVYENNLLQEQKKWISSNKKAARLSRLLAKGLGLINKKGLPVRQDRQLASWHKRKSNLLKKIKKIKVILHFLSIIY